MATITTKKVAERDADAVGKTVTYVQTVVCDYTDFEAAAASDTVAGAAVANAWPTGRVERYLSEEFAAPAASAIGAEYGDSGDADGLSASTDVLDGSGSVDSKWTVVAPGADAAGRVFHSSYTPLVTLSVTDDTCDDLTQGKIAYRFFYEVVEAR